MVILYEKGASIFGIRVFLISVLLLYIGFAHKPGEIWSDSEFWIIGTIAAAHIFTVNRNSFPYKSDKKSNIKKKDENDDSNINDNVQIQDNQNWFLSFLFFSWLFHDSDDDHF